VSVHQLTRTEWAKERQPLLDEWAAIIAARSAARARGAGVEEVGAITDQIGDVRRRYTDALPRLPVARDPFTDDIVTVALDNAGLDGPYWNAENPARPAETMPSTFVVLSGAMRLARDHTDELPHLCVPGPPVPFVVPALLGRDGVMAVVSTVPVGAHTGYAITYFSDAGPQPPPLPNEWGRREYWLRDADGRPTTMASSYDTDPAPDFDLLHWLREGKVMWIAPGDPRLRLRTTEERCPYVFAVGGDQRHQRIGAGPRQNRIHKTEGKAGDDL